MAEAEVPPGTYWVRVLVNADQTIKENAADNAMLFPDPIAIGKSSNNSATRPFQKEVPPGDKEDDTPTDSGD